jgi:MmyB-like transcription regulator ligand binding domain
VFGRRFDILAWNTSAAALYTDFAQLPPNRRSRPIRPHPTFSGLINQYRQAA